MHCVTQSVYKSLLNDVVRHHIPEVNCYITYTAPFLYPRADMTCPCNATTRKDGMIMQRQAMVYYVLTSIE
jgi:hypothetical protein